MSSRQPNGALAALCVLLYAQVVCFFFNAVDNLFATFRLTFIGHKGAALAQPVVPSAQLNNILLVSHTLVVFYLICCLIFFLMPFGLLSRKPAFFVILLILDTISLALGLYGYYFWATSGTGLSSTEMCITVVEPFLSSSGLLLLLAVPGVRRLWWPSR